MGQASIVRRGLAAVWGLGFGAYVIHGMVTDTGLVGWLEYGQQSLIGVYSMKLTLLCVMVLWAIPFMALLPRSDRNAAQTLRARANSPVTARGTILVSLVSIVVVWVGGYALRAWFIQQDRQDYEAQYEELRLKPGASVAPTSEHVALWGEPLDDATVSFSQRNTTSYYLIPVVAPGWQKGQPISIVVKSKVSDIREPPHFDPETKRIVQAPGPILARVSGVVSVPAAQEFSRMGLALSEPHHLLERIQSQQGKPLAPNLEEAQLAYLCIAGFLTFFILVIGTVVLVKRPKTARVVNDPSR
jgi:hypothetical protein